MIPASVQQALVYKVKWGVLGGGGVVISCLKEEQGVFAQHMMYQYMLDKQLQHFEDIENKNKTDNFEVSHVTYTLRVATRTV